MLATDKQIKYLTDLTNKVNRIIDLWPECGVEKFYIDWRHERSRGMNINDASIKISAFKKPDTWHQHEESPFQFTTILSLIWVAFGLPQYTRL